MLNLGLPISPRHRFHPEGLAGFLTESQQFVKDLDVKEMLEQSQNARNKQDAAWRQFIQLLEYKGEFYGTHVVTVEAAGTTKECAKCDGETAKPIWVRGHSCLSCGVECGRDVNATMNVLQRGFA